MPKLWIKIFVCLFIISSSISAERYKDALYEVEKISKQIYASNVPHLSKEHFVTSLVAGLRLPSGNIPCLYFYQNATEITYENLFFDLYRPKNDKVRNRPLVIILHGGGFVSGARDDENQPIVDFCDSLATRGYVVASIDYRIGLVLKAFESQLLVDSLDFERSVQWGIRDLQTAILFFRNHAEEYGINREKIFIVGNSSGAILAMQSVCEKNNINPNAVVSLWGAVLDKEKIKNVSVPILLIHGIEDDVIPFREGRILNLDSIKERNRDVLGYGPIASSFNINFTSPIFYGSFVIDSVLKRNGVFHETYFEDDVGHEFYDKKLYKIRVFENVLIFLYKLSI